MAWCNFRSMGSYLLSRPHVVGQVNWVFEVCLLYLLQLWPRNVLASAMEFPLTFPLILDITVVMGWWANCLFSLWQHRHCQTGDPLNTCRVRAYIVQGKSLSCTLMFCWGILVSTCAEPCQSKADGMKSSIMGVIGTENTWCKSSPLYHVQFRMDWDHTT